MGTTTKSESWTTSWIVSEIAGRCVEKYSFDFRVLPLLKQCGQLPRLRVGEMQLIFRSRFPPVPQATLWIGIYEDDGTSLSGFNSQVASEGGFADATFLCDERVDVHLRNHVSTLIRS